MTVSAATVPGIHQYGIHSSRPAANVVAAGALYACSTHNLIYMSDGSSWATWATLGVVGSVATVNFVIDGGGSAITTGTKGYLEIPFAATITAARLLADVSGSCVIDIFKADYSGLPPSSSICASAKPTLSSAQKSQDTTLTGWTTSIAAGDWLGYSVSSASTVTRVTVSLTLLR
jgi:hypothetical protein